MFHIDRDVVMFNSVIKRRVTNNDRLFPVCYRQIFAVIINAVNNVNNN